MKEDKKLSLSVQFASNARKLPTRPQFRRWVKAALQQDVQMVLRIVDEIEGRALNQSYRGKDYATNVLTFVYDDSEPLYGDVVICAPVVTREAKSRARTCLPITRISPFMRCCTCKDTIMRTGGMPQRWRRSRQR